MGKFVIISLLVLLVSLDAEALPLFRNFNIVISNNLKSSKVLKVHCRSKDDDPPFHFLDVNTAYELKFTVYPKTLYWCNLWQGPNYKHYARFDAFVADDHFIDDVCGGRKPNVCTWVATEEGIYVRNNARGDYKLLYKWDATAEQNIP
ncbi:PREDICTED: uncharacterized protein LOC104813236 [Tarenaya hassleriana]|uniref:uncharacterized protein LOC104813236 n=1 Tax=Tarenaya hassleriana TaxID=28532 RepID=UPI00053CA1B4|nr:PREDICTED: uncharacterized protein LOC104813236 [Tarenaya hassleriana]